MSITVTELQQMVEIGEQHLRDFQDNEKTIPTVLTTPKTFHWVDARNVRNIVLFRLEFND